MSDEKVESAIRTVKEYIIQTEMGGICDASNNWYRTLHSLNELLYKVKGN